MRVVPIIFCVAMLNILRCPSAIGGLILFYAFIAFAAGVMPMRVNAVDSVLVAGSEPHVFNECFDGFSPSLANVVPNSSVVRIVVIGGIVASCDHAFVNFVFPCMRESVRTTWMTSAGLANIANEMVGSDLAFFPALNATTHPLSSTWAGHVRRQKQQRSDSITDLKIGRTKDSLMISHDVTSYKGCDWSGPTDAPTSARLASLYATRPDLGIPEAIAQ